MSGFFGSISIKNDRVKHVLLYSLPCGESNSSKSTSSGGFRHFFVTKSRMRSSTGWIF